MSKVIQITLAFVALTAFAFSQSVPKQSEFHSQTNDGTVFASHDNNLLSSGATLSTTTAFGSSSAMYTVSCGGTNLCWQVVNGGTGSSVVTADRRKLTPIVTVKHVDASRLPISRAHLAPASYIKLAHVIDMDAPSVSEARMLEALTDLAIPAYDFDKVDAYLQQQAAKVSQNAYWVWHPMRRKDANSMNVTGYTHWSETTGNIDASKIYSRQLPEDAMLVAASILAKMPEAIFLVSDYEIKRPDPFLAVSTTDLLSAGKLWVVARWDEPGFGKEPPAQTVQLLLQQH